MTSNLNDLAIIMIDFDFELCTLCRTAEALGIYTISEFVDFIDEISIKQTVAHLQGYGY